MAQNYDLPMFRGELFDDCPERVAQILLAIGKLSARQRAEIRQFGFNAHFLQMKLRECDCSPSPQPSFLIAASIDRDAAQPWIKGPVNIK